MVGSKKTNLKFSKKRKFTLIRKLLVPVPLLSCVDHMCVNNFCKNDCYFFQVCCNPMIGRVVGW
jgi:hypothetical protein